MKANESHGKSMYIVQLKAQATQNDKNLQIFYLEQEILLMIPTAIDFNINCHNLLMACKAQYLNEKNDVIHLLFSKYYALVFLLVFGVDIYSTIE